MNPVVLSEDQAKNLSKMSAHFFGENASRSMINEQVYVVNINWLEFALYHLLPKVAEVHGKQPYTTSNWSERMVRQKIINELPDVNPIDTLYDIWKHPDKYAQNM